MSDVPSPATEQPAAHHYGQAAAHARRAADLFERAQRRTGKGERASAVELAKGACGQLGEAYSHAAQSQRLYAQQEAEAGGSHWNDPGDEQRTH